MGIYLNPGAGKFQEDIHSQIYVDMTGMISFTNKVLSTQQKYLCVSRPRRFGKSMAANMLCAYYDHTVDQQPLFSSYEIAADESYEKYAGKFDVIKLNMQEFLSRTDNMKELLERLKKILLRDLLRTYPAIDYFDQNDLIECMQDIYVVTHRKFILIIDEWDCIFREEKNHKKEQNQYLDFLRDWMKDKEYIALAYMTGILPIKKYGTHSALNMFSEFSMENPRQLARYVGFTGEQVKALCKKYRMDFDECKRWYDGYSFLGIPSIYNPKSVVEAMLGGVYDTYWNRTETYEALRIYIDLDMDGLRDAIIKLIAGGRQRINTGTFVNDMVSLHSADDVLTLLVHLGYLAYDFEREEVRIPNHEVEKEFINATDNKNWGEVARAVRVSDALLQAIWEQDETSVAAGIEKTHFETSQLTYNDENALSYTLSLALYAARRYYTVVREMPAGKGFADLVFLPRPANGDKPAMLVELKWNQDADTAIRQIKEKRYGEFLQGYHGGILIVGVNYDKKTKHHTCKIEKVEK